MKIYRIWISASVPVEVEACDTAEALDLYRSGEGTPNFSQTIFGDYESIEQLPQKGGDN